MNSGRKIALLHHLGGGNLGDDATLDAVIYCIRERWPSAQLIGFSMNPQDTQKRHGISAYALRKRTWGFGYKPGVNRETTKERMKQSLSRFRFLLSLLRGVYALVIRAPKSFFQELAFLCSSYRAIRSFDMLIVSGGGQLTDWYGPWAFLYTIFKWILLARLARVKCLFLNVGAGPIATPLSRFFARKSLSLADYVSFRDEDSSILASNIGFSGKGYVIHDSAYSLPISVPIAHKGNGMPAEENVIIGLAPMPYCDPRIYPKKDQAFYDNFIRIFGQFGLWLLKEGYSLDLFGSDIGIDPLAVEDLRNAIVNPKDFADPLRVINEMASSTQDLWEQMSRMEYVVTCRFHGVVFAHMLNKPVLAISHHPKVTTLMDDLGLAEYCLDIHSIDADLLARKFRALVNNRDCIKARMRERLDCYRRDLTAQFDALFAAEINYR